MFEAHKKSVIEEIEEHWISFAMTFLGVFVLLFVILLLTDVVPDSMSVWKTGGSTAPAVVTSTPSPSAYESPVRIEIDAISLKATIANPATTSVEVLDEALLRGAVRYPTSALLGQEGTMVLFGHSSYLPVVHNQAYKTFDGIQDLHKGDIISVFSGAHEYHYAVTEVRTANVSDDNTNTLHFSQTGKHLVLITCDSFATKSDRYIVTADLTE
ncbi:MAG TPA: sortase [Candidatus Paceibacterota bacterium]